MASNREHLVTAHRSYHCLTEDADIANSQTTQNTPYVSECGLHQLLVLSNYNNLTKFFNVAAYTLWFVYNSGNPNAKQI